MTATGTDGDHLERLVAGLLLNGGDWQPALFEPYAAERAERLRRARFVAPALGPPAPRRR